MKIKSIWKYIFQRVMLIFFCKGRDKQTQENFIKTGKET